VIVDIDDETSEIVLLIHWQGGLHTEMRRPKRRCGEHRNTPKSIVEAIGELDTFSNRVC
jgi:hypothetical protein